MSDGGWLAPPASFGFDGARFTDWRVDQPAAIQAALEAPTRFRGLVLPVGSGKTLTALTIAKLTGWRTVYLTSTKALQDQVQNEHRWLHVLKGQAAYPCRALAPGGEYDDWNPDGEWRGCHEGPCHVGKACTHRGDEGTIATCDYFGAVAKAMRAPIVVPNYSAWLAHRIHAVGLGKVDCLVLDEAHAAPDELAGALRVEIKDSDVSAVDGAKWPKGDQDDPAYWGRLKAWAAGLEHPLQAVLDSHRPSTRAEGQYYRRVDRLVAALMRLRLADPAVTILRDEYGTLTIEPVWAATHVDALWKDIPHVIAMSATVRPKTMMLLGVSESETTWFESEGDFPVARRPVYHIPTVRMRHDMTPDQEAWWLSRIDDILRARPDVKGIIHTVSYARRNRILQRSQFRERLISHDRDDAAKQVQAFKRADGPLVLVSPSITTGYDFPHAECLATGTRVLTQDLRWVPIEDIREGDLLIGIDEHRPQMAYCYRGIRESVVFARRSRTAQTFWVRTTKGDIRATAEHPFLGLVSKKRRIEWLAVRDLKPGNRLYWLARPTAPLETYEAGYLSGLFDGEGHVDCGRRNALSRWSRFDIGFSQKPGATLDRGVARLRALGYQLALHECRHPTGPVMQVKILGSMADRLAFLSSVRPERLIANVRLDGKAGRDLCSAIVLAVEPAGVTDVHSLQTTTETYFAEGIATHNCRFQIVGKVPFPDGRDPITARRTLLDPDYPAYVAMQELVQATGRGMRAKDDWCETFVIDDNFGWFVKKYRSFAPTWFLKAVRRSDTLPPRPTW